MSPDNNSPVKGFRPLGGNLSQQKPPEPEKQDWTGKVPSPQTPAPSPVPESSFTPPPSAQSSGEYTMPEPEPWENSVNNSRTAAPPPWQQAPADKVAQPQQQPYQQQSQPQQPYQPQYGHNVPAKNPGTAFALELVGGIFGLFGIGYMYAGRTSEGVIRIVVGILCNIFIAVLASVTFGICAFIAIPFYIGFAIMSANSIKNYLIKQQTP